jgi:hypothetical protein
MSSESKSFRTCPLFSRLALLLVTLACLPLLASGGWWSDSSEIFGPEVCHKLALEDGPALDYRDAACMAVVTELRGVRFHNASKACNHLYWYYHGVHWRTNEYADWHKKIHTKVVCHEVLRR